MGTHSSLGPGPRYDVSVLLPCTTASPAPGFNPLTTQCRQNANFGSSGDGASGSVRMKVQDASDGASASVTSGRKENRGACLHSLARKKMPRSTALFPKDTASLVVGLNDAGIRPAAGSGTRLPAEREDVRAEAWLTRDILDCSCVLSVVMKIVIQLINLRHMRYHCEVTTS